MKLKVGDRAFYYDMHTGAKSIVTIFAQRNGIYFINIPNVTVPLPCAPHYLSLIPEPNDLLKDLL